MIVGRNDLLTAALVGGLGLVEPPRRPGPLPAYRLGLAAVGAVTGGVSAAEDTDDPFRARSVAAWATFSAGPTLAAADVGLTLEARAVAGLRRRGVAHLRPVVALAGAAGLRAQLATARVVDRQRDEVGDGWFGLRTADGVARVFPAAFTFPVAALFPAVEGEPLRLRVLVGDGRPESVQVRPVDPERWEFTVPPWSAVTDWTLVTDAGG